MPSGLRCIAYLSRDYGRIDRLPVRMPGRHINSHQPARMPGVLHSLNSARHGCPAIHHGKASWGIGPHRTTPDVTREMRVVPLRSRVKSINSHG